MLLNSLESKGLFLISVITIFSVGNSYVMNRKNANCSTIFRIYGKTKCIKPLWSLAGWFFWQKDPKSPVPFFRLKMTPGSLIRKKQLPFQHKKKEGKKGEKLEMGSHIGE